jgi:hypothetical protein
MEYTKYIYTVILRIIEIKQSHTYFLHRCVHAFSTSGAFQSFNLQECALINENVNKYTLDYISCTYMIPLEAASHPWRH